MVLGVAVRAAVVLVDIALAAKGRRMDAPPPPVAVVVSSPPSDLTNGTLQLRQDLWKELWWFLPRPIRNSAPR